MQGEAAGGRRPSHEDGPGADGASRARGWHPSDPLPAPSTSSLLSRKTETGKNYAQDDGVEESEKADGMPAERTRVPYLSALGAEKTKEAKRASVCLICLPYMSALGAEKTKEAKRAFVQGRQSLPVVRLLYMSALYVCLIYVILLRLPYTSS